MFIGLTGGMGCGKSTASSCFSKLGYKTLDADKICHELYSNKSSQLFEILYKRWGEKIISSNDTIERAVVAKIVFADKDELNWLNSVLHPAVLEEGIRIYNRLDKKKTVFAVPLLFEVKWESYFDKTVTVWCNEKIRLKRLLNRGMSENEVKIRDKRQWDPQLKMERADYVIINNSTLANLQQQCSIIVKKQQNK